MHAYFYKKIINPRYFENDLILLFQLFEWGTNV